MKYINKVGSFACVLLFSILCILSFDINAQSVSVVYYHNDLLGSPVATTDEQGSVIWRQDYQPYGEKLSDDMEAEVEKVGYTGHRYDSGTGLVYAGARMYDPALGRFMGIDPVSSLVAVDNPVMFNRYAYGNNNPYKYVDPTGEIPLVVVAIWILKEVGGEVFEQTTGIPAPTVKNAGKYALEKAMRKSIKDRKVIKGVYKFKEGDQEYIGQSKDVMKRIQQHASNKDKFAEDKAGTLEVKKVKGDKFDREKTEQRMIDDATDGDGAKSDLVSNKVNPCRRRGC